VRTRNKAFVGIAAASLAVMGIVMMAVAQGGPGMMGRSGARMMGGTAATSARATGTCPMGKAQCSASGAASCPMLSSGSAGSGASASCPAAKANGTCKMSTGGMPATCPMTQGNTGA
jgi:hypothetical protein